MGINAMIMEGALGYQEISLLEFHLNSTVRILLSLHAILLLSPVSTSVEADPFMPCTLNHIHPAFLAPRVINSAGN